LKRVYFVDKVAGTQRLGGSDFPLSIGGAGADIALEDAPEGAVLAHIALSSGHAYVQPANEAVELFHNHEYTTASAWLKSGDRIELGESVLDWVVKGDQVFIRVRGSADEPDLQPPSMPPPDNGDAGEEKTDHEDVSEGAPRPRTITDENEHDTRIIPIATAAMPPARRRRLRALVFSVFVLLSLAALFVLLATPVSVTIMPEPDSQSVSGFPPPVSFGRRMLVIPGNFTVRANHPGYQPLEREFEVLAGGFQSFSFEMEELPGQIKITTDPSVPIRVLVGEIEAEIDADNIVSVQRGSRQLRIETERYLTETVDFEVAGFGELQELNITLKPAWADVQLDSLPTGAEVAVDGESIGSTPLDAEILQGQRNIELSLAGFKTAGIEEVFVAGTTVVLDTVTLEPNDGALLLESQPGGATVTVDGTFKGSTPVALVLTSGVPHRIQLSEPGYLSTRQTVTVQADEERQLTVKLSPEYGIVFSSSDPADASLTLDGKPAGTGTQRLRLTTRPHVLVYSKTGYVSQTINGTPRADTSQNGDVILKTLVQAKEDARPAVLRTAGGQEMPLIEPSGSFRMGASRREAGRRANESQRLVELTRAYYLSGKEVTNAEYRRFKSAHNSGSAEGVSLNADDLPVVNVSWDDAARYCNWLSGLDKLPPAYVEQDGQMKLQEPATIGYRLPTEAEWVYAARIAGREAPARYPWGEGFPPRSRVGNFADAQIADTLAVVVTDYNDWYRGPSPVGSFDAQPEGFHDFGGNVAEWTNDFYAVYPGQADRLVRDPAGPASGDHHVVRGSSWRDGSITELRLSYRDYSRGPRDNLGFRIARYADE
jgi:formylglycine-generating enzyme required for sulfatase activity